MSDANELLAAIKKSVTDSSCTREDTDGVEENCCETSLPLDVWCLPCLVSDVHVKAKAGNLPDEWTINIVRMTLDDVRVTKRIAQLQAEAADWKRLSEAKVVELESDPSEAEIGRLWKIEIAARHFIDCRDKTKEKAKGVDTQDDAVFYDHVRARGAVEEEAEGQLRAAIDAKDVSGE